MVHPIIIVLRLEHDSYVNLNLIDPNKTIIILLNFDLEKKYLINYNY